MSTPERTRRDRIPLWRDRVLRTALAHADAAGLEGLTMRRLAQMLDVVPMALYRHVANKDDLIDGMVDQVFGEIPLPSADLAWKSWMRERAISVRHALVRHPWACWPGSSRTRRCRRPSGSRREPSSGWRSRTHATCR